MEGDQNLVNITVYNDFYKVVCICISVIFSTYKIGDPFDPTITDYVNELVSNMTSEAWAFSAFSMINDTATVNDPSFYGANYSSVEDHGTSHLSVLAPNGDAVSLTSTINYGYIVNKNRLMNFLV